MKDSKHNKHGNCGCEYDCNCDAQDTTKPVTKCGYFWFIGKDNCGYEHKIKLSPRGLFNLINGYIEFPEIPDPTIDTDQWNIVEVLDNGNVKIQLTDKDGNLGDVVEICNFKPLGCDNNQLTRDSKIITEQQIVTHDRGFYTPFVPESERSCKPKDLISCFKDVIAYTRSEGISWQWKDGAWSKLFLAPRSQDVLIGTFTTDVISGEGQTDGNGIINLTKFDPVVMNNPYPCHDAELRLFFAPFMSIIIGEVDIANISYLANAGITVNGGNFFYGITDAYNAEIQHNETGQGTQILGRTEFVDAGDSVEICPVVQISSPSVNTEYQITKLCAGVQIYGIWVPRVN